MAFAWSSCALTASISDGRLPFLRLARLASACASRAAASSRAGCSLERSSSEQRRASGDLRAARDLQGLEPAGDRRGDVDVFALDVALDLQRTAAAKAHRRSQRDQRAGEPVGQALEPAHRGDLEAAQEQIEMRPDQRLHVQRPGVVVRLERALPERCDQHGRDHAEDRVVDVDGAELAARDPAPQDPADQPEAATHDLVDIEARKVRKIAGLGDHELRDRADPGVHDTRDGREHPLEQHGTRAFEGRRQGLDPGEVRQQRLAHDRLEQLLLAVEVEVERALADAGAGGDVLDPGGGEAASGEALQRRSKDLLRPRLLAATPAGRRCLVHGNAHDHLTD